MHRRLVTLLAASALLPATGYAGPVTLDMHAGRSGFWSVWGTVTVDVRNNEADFLVEVDRHAVESVYGLQDFYIGFMGFESAFSFDHGSIKVSSPVDCAHTTRSPAADHFDYEVRIEPTTGLPVPPDTLRFSIPDLPSSVTTETFLSPNELIEEVFGWSTPWMVGLRFPDNTRPELPNTLYLYSGTNPVPEPSTLALLGLGAVGLLLRRKVRK